MKKLLFALAALALFCSEAASAQVGFGGMFPGPGTPASGGGGGPPSCSAYTTFIARTSGTSTNEQTAYKYIICNGTTHGWFSKCDAVYWFATNTAASAVLNLESTSFSITNNGATFTADQGYTGNGSSAYLDTGFKPSVNGVNYTAGAQVLGVYNLTSSTTGQDYGDIGVTDTGNGTNISVFPKFTDNNAYAQFTGNVDAAATNRSGLWNGTQTSSTNLALYHNGSSFATSTNGTGTLPTLNVFILAINNNNTGVAHPSGDQLAAAFMCGSFTATDAANASTDINNAATALGINVY